MINKLLSGRYILTLISGIVFLILSVNQVIEAKDVVMIIMVVVSSYFTKDRSNDKDNKPL